MGETLDELQDAYERLLRHEVRCFGVLVYSTPLGV